MSVGGSGFLSLSVGSGLLIGFFGLSDAGPGLIAPGSTGASLDFVGVAVPGLRGSPMVLLKVEGTMEKRGAQVTLHNIKYPCQAPSSFYSAGMAKETSIAGRSCAPACRVINETPMPPTHTIPNKYPGGRANTEPGNPKYQVDGSKAGYPDHVLPKGSEL